MFHDYSPAAIADLPALWGKELSVRKGGIVNES